MPSQPGSFRGSKGGRRVEFASHLLVVSILEYVELCHMPPIRWMGPRVRLDAVAKRKNPSRYREMNLGCSVRSLVTILSELPRLVHYNISIEKSGLVHWS